MTATQTRPESRPDPADRVPDRVIEDARTGGRPGARRPRIDRVWAACAVVAALVILVAAFMPLWRMELLAPQYPAGLTLDAYGTRMAGDLREINTLNHYVGIRAIDPDALLELRVFPFAIGALIAAVLVGAVVARRRWSRLLLAAAVWCVPLGLLADLQWWLHQYGHDLDPTAPFRLEPFTPKVLGSTVVVNFHTEAMLASGSWMFLGAGLLLALGPPAVRFVRDSWKNTGDASRVAALAVVLVATLVAALPRDASAQETPYSIAAAIAAAAPGETVAVPPGVHTGIVTVDRPIVLDGGGAAVLDGGGEGDVVRIVAEGVTVRGFVVRNSGRNVSQEPAGIRVLADHATIEDNRLEDVLYGIALHDSNGHVVHGNQIRSVTALAPERRGHAISVWYSTDNLIEENTLEAAKDGIFLGFAERTHVRGNLVTHLRYGLHTMYAVDLLVADNVFRDNVAGASLMYSRRLEVTGNEFSGSRSPASGYGLLLKDMDDVTIRGNRIVGNRLGMTMEGAPRTPGAIVEIRGNLVASNQVALELFSTADAAFTENSFIGNLQQVRTQGGSLERRNAWSSDGRGNYWDDYQGFDADGDGIGDLAYRYEGAYDELLRRNEAVRAYAFTPARSALELAARWFPVYRVEPRVVDERPLMRPVIDFTSAAPQRSAAPMLASLALAAIAGAAFLVGQRSIGRRWSPC